MTRNHFELTHASTFNRLLINSHPTPCCIEILNRLYERFYQCIERYSRVLFVRIDVHFPLHYNCDDPDKVFRLFMADYARERREEAGLKHYVWRKHWKNGQLPHWHIVLLFNGHFTRNAHEHLSKAEKCWGRILGVPGAGGLINWCRPRQANHLPNGVLLERGSIVFNAYLAHCFYWASYLAQHRPSILPLNSRSYGYSNLLP